MVEPFASSNRITRPRSTVHATNISLKRAVCQVFLINQLLPAVEQDKYSLLHNKNRMKTKSTILNFSPTSFCLKHSLPHLTVRGSVEHAL